MSNYVQTRIEACSYSKIVRELKHDFRKKKVDYLRDTEFHNRYENYESDEYEKCLKDLKHKRDEYAELFRKKFKRKLKDHKTTHIRGVVTLSNSINELFEKGELSGEKAIDLLLKSTHDVLEQMRIEAGLDKPIDLNSITIHFDEKVVHAHFICSNFDDEGNNIHWLINKTEKLTKLQDASAQSFDELGYKRGKTKTVKRKDHLSVVEMHKAERDAALSEKQRAYQERDEATKQMIKAKQEQQKALRELKAKGDLSKQEIKELNTKIKQLKEEVKELKAGKTEIKKDINKRVNKIIQDNDKLLGFDKNTASEQMKKLLLLYSRTKFTIKEAEEAKLALDEMQHDFNNLSKHYEDALKEKEELEVMIAQNSNDNLERKVIKLEGDLSKSKDRLEQAIKQMETYKEDARLYSELYTKTHEQLEMFKKDERERSC